MKKKKSMNADKKSGMWLGTAICAAMLLAAGCSSDTEKDAPEGDGRVALQVNSGINMNTRAYDKTWEAGDAIGIYMLNGTQTEAANKQYITGAESATATFDAAPGNTIYFPIDGSTRDFIAYYPYRDMAEENASYTVDVTNQNPQRNIDLMGATRVTGKHKNDPKVAFTFGHKLVKLLLTIKPDGTTLTAADMEGLAVKLTNQRTRATYDVLTDGSITPDTQSAPATLLLDTNTDGTSTEAIVLPCTDTEGMILEFHLKSNEIFRWAIKDAPLSQKFVAGSKYLYTINISKNRLEVTSTVTDWSPGNGDGESGSAQ